MTNEKSENPAGVERFSPGTVRIYRIEQEDDFGDARKLERLGEYGDVYLNITDNRNLTVVNGEREIFSGEHHYMDIADGQFTYECFRIEDPNTGVWGKYRIEYFFRREDPERALPEREDQAHD